MKNQFKNKIFVSVILAVLMLISISCNSPQLKFFANHVDVAFRPVDKVKKNTNPKIEDAKLAVLWVGHATALIQIEDKFIMTDPNLTNNVGMLQKRLIEAGIDPENVPKLDAVLISHNHMDHLSYKSLDLIENKITRAFVPKEGLTYMPNYDFPCYEIHTWQTWTRDGLSITAVPVQHRGGRYGLDESYMKISCTGYVIQYKGITVYFGGDTGYNSIIFNETREKFPNIDLALIPIAPISPRDFMQHAHVDPDEAVQAFKDLGAKHMMPIHFDSYPNSTQDTILEAPQRLRTVANQNNIDENTIKILKAGEQWILMRK